MKINRVAVTIRALALVSLMLPVHAAHAANEVSCDLDLTTTKPAALVRGKVKSIGLMAGVRWGSGTLELPSGEKRNFKIIGAKLLESGAASNEFVGEVYNLQNVTDFEGTYFGISKKVSIGTSKGDGVVNNQHCVVVKLRATGSGLQLSAPAPGGVEVSFTN